MAGTATAMPLKNSVRHMVSYDVTECPDDTWATRSPMATDGWHSSMSLASKGPQNINGRPGITIM